MKRTDFIMGMPITIEIVGNNREAAAIKKIFNYLRDTDERFSTYKQTSEISQINNGKPRKLWSSEMTDVLELCDLTRRQTNGYFDIKKSDGILDPSGLVKGWAINNAADILRKLGFKNFFIDGGGDIQADGKNSSNTVWKIGIRNPFNVSEIVKTVGISGEGIATSGTYIRGQHIYDPLRMGKPPENIASLTVIGQNIYEADRFATAAFAMGLNGISFIESLPGFEGYMIDNNKTATMTSGFERYVI
jgi:FAD:protein FMN transferase